MSRKLIISPSVLAADFGSLAEEFARIDQYKIPYVHMDVLDGQFAPNLSYGPKFIRDTKKLSSAEPDVHLMIRTPERTIQEYLDIGIARIAFHAEEVRFPFRLIGEIRKTKTKVGVALNPATPLSVLDHLLSEIDYVLIMSVDPGFYGQTYIPGMTEKIKNLDLLRKERGLSFEIQVDGGLDSQTLPPILGMIDIAVLGKAFFRNPDLQNLIDLVS